MGNLLDDECIETRCEGCRQTIPRSFGYLRRRVFDICLCGKVTNLRMENFQRELENMNLAGQILAESLLRLKSAKSPITARTPHRAIPKRG